MNHDLPPHCKRRRVHAACLAAVWNCPPGQDLEPPPGVALDILGVIVGAPQLDDGGGLIPGEVIDPRYHVSLAWYGREPDPSFQASLVVPATPSRGWDVAPPLPPAPSVPEVIPARKGKAALREAGLLDAVEAAIAAAGGRVQDAWFGTAEWSRHSQSLSDLTSALGLSAAQIDEMFQSTDNVNS